MDVYIDTEAVTSGIDSISISIDNLTDIVSFLTARLLSAGGEFQNINFERASESINVTVSALDEMGENLKIAQEYLKRIVEYIERYHSFRFY